MVNVDFQIASVKSLKNLHITRKMTKSEEIKELKADNKRLATMCNRAVKE